jgi:hypothetical protein
MPGARSTPFGLYNIIIGEGWGKHTRPPLASGDGERGAYQRRAQHCKAECAQTGCPVIPRPSAPHEGKRLTRSGVHPLPWITRPSLTPCGAKRLTGHGVNKVLQEGAARSFSNHSFPFSFVFFKNSLFSASHHIFLTTPPRPYVVSVWVFLQSHTEAYDERTSAAGKG